MSHTEMYAAARDGDVVSYAEFANAHGGAMAVWRLLIEKYFGVTGVEFIMMMDDGFKELFRLGDEGKLEPWENAVLTTTCDKVLVPVEHIEIVASAMEKFAEEYGPGEAAKNHVFSIGDQAKELRRMLAEREEHGWRGVCWSQMSVSDTLWEGRYEELVEGDPASEERLPYNIDKHEDHWTWPKDGS